MIQLAPSELTPAQFKELFEHLSVKQWRMDNLYWIKNKQGIVVPFRRNPIQQKLMTTLSNRNMVVKSRQPGVSTGFMIDYLDAAIFTKNLAIGIIAHKLEVAGNFLDIMRLAYDMLPDLIKDNCKLKSDVKSRELSFENGSSIYVSTSFRSSAIQILHISEMGYICAKNPDKADEIITGALESVAVGQTINIESTAMGNEGYFAKQVEKAMEKLEKNEPLTELDYKLHFFPWMDDPTCVLKDEDAELVTIYPEQTKYFEKVEREYKNKLTRNQKTFYVKKQESLGDKIKKEYPSYIKEAFEYSNEGTYYIDQFIFLRRENRIVSVPYQEGNLVDIGYDLGLDGTVLWFCQTVGKEYHIIDCFYSADLSYGFIYDEVMKKRYRLGTHVLPFDAANKNQDTMLSKLENITNLFQTRNFFICPPPVKISREDGIQTARSFFSVCWFDKIKCHEGLEGLENYSKRWNSSLGRYIDEPVHNDACVTGDTKIRTLNGWIPIQDLVGKEFYVWSYNKEQKRLYPAKANRCWKTKTTNQLLEICLDNNQSIKCTPKHKFMLRDGSYKEARDLTAGISLMPFYESYNKGKYCRIHLNDGSEAREHLYVYTVFNGYLENGHIIHHKDNIILNNNPDNLIKMTIGEHISIHASEPDRLEKFKKCCGRGLKYSTKNTEHLIQMNKKRGGENHHTKNPEYFTDELIIKMKDRLEKFKKCCGRGLKYSTKNTEHLIQMNKKRGGENHHTKNPEYFTDELIIKMKDGWRESYEKSTAERVCPVCGEIFISGWRRTYCCNSCKGRHTRAKRENYTAKWTAESCLHSSDCLRINKENHKIIAINEIIGEYDVYDIDVPEFHNFVAEGVVIHNSHFSDSFRYLAIYKTLMMRLGNRQDRRSIENALKKPNNKIPWGRGFT